MTPSEGGKRGQVALQLRGAFLDQLAPLGSQGGGLPISSKRRVGTVKFEGHAEEIPLQSEETMNQESGAEKQDGRQHRIAGPHRRGAIDEQNHVRRVERGTNR